MVARKRYSQRNKIGMLLVVILFATVGTYLLAFSHADSPPVTSQSGAPGPDGTFTRINSARAAYNGYLYVIEAAASSSQPATVYFTHTNADGALGSWMQTNSLPAFTGRFSAQLLAVASGGYIYVLDAAHQISYYAPLNANGTVGSWSTISNNYPTACNESNSDPTAFLAYGGKLYTYNQNSDAVTTSFCYARIASNGSLGTWSTTTTAPVSSTEKSPAFTIINDYIYSAGPRNLGSTQDYTTYFAPINADGSLGTWRPTTAIPVAAFFDGGNPSDPYGGYGANFATGVFATSQYLYVSITFSNLSGVTHNYILYAPFTIGGMIGDWHYIQVADQSQSPITTNGHVYSFVFNTRPSSIVSAGLTGNTDQTGPGSGSSPGPTGSATSRQSAAANGGSAANSSSSTASGSAASGSSGSSAVSAKNVQGTETNPAPTPNPFYDGKQYPAGSDADSTGGRAARQKHFNWEIAILGVCTIGACIVGLWLFWRRQRRNK